MRQRPGGAGAAGLGDLRSQCVPRRRGGARCSRCLHDLQPVGHRTRRSGRCTLAHGDLATVNMAFVGDDLVLIDWAMPTAAPGALDLTRFIVGCSSSGRAEPGLDAGAGLPGALPDRRTTSTLASASLSARSRLAWLGLEQGADVVRTPRPATRAREQADLDGGVAETRKTLASGGLPMDLYTLYHRPSRAGRTGSTPSGRSSGTIPRRAGTGRCGTWSTTCAPRTGGPLPMRVAPSRTWATASTATCSATTRSAAPWPPPPRPRWPWPRHCGRHGTVHLSHGDEKIEEYVHQLAADHLSRLGPGRGHRRRQAAGPARVTEVATWFADREEAVPDGGGRWGPRTASHGDAQCNLLADFGRDPGGGPTTPPS